MKKRRDMLIRVPGGGDKNINLTFAPRDQVTLKVVPEIHAMIVGIVIRPSGVLYECNWIADSGLQTGFFADFELERIKPIPTPGFRGSRKR